MTGVDRVLGFLKNSKTFYIATEENGRPKVRPFGFAMAFEGRIYFVTGSHKPFFTQIKANPYVEICAVDEKYDWLRLSGRAIPDRRSEVRERAFAVEPGLASVYTEPDNPIFQCFYLADAKAAFCSMSAPQVVIIL